MSEVHSWRELDGDYAEYLGDAQAAVAASLHTLASKRAVQELWARHGALYSADPAVMRDVEDRLGWLDLPNTMRVEVPRLRALALELAERGITRAILLGMGGSSLAPEVLDEVLGGISDGMDLAVLDATDPAQILRVRESSDMRRTVVIASSKSGTTAETRTLMQYFGQEFKAAVGDRWIEHVIVISDPGTPLQALAKQESLFAQYAAAPDVGGRYSALTLFGLVPAALVGIDCDRLLRSAGEMAHRCRASIAEPANPGARLGAAMATLALAGRDKLTIITSPALASFGWWAEQLIAESTGKDGTGILPVEGEPTFDPAGYGDDRLFCYVRLQDDDNAATDARVDALIAAGCPVLVTRLADRYALGAEFFRWEFATAIAGLVLGINPFDQPNVEDAKDAARAALARYTATGALDEATPALQADGMAFYGEAANDQDVRAYLGAFLHQATDGDYVALMAYVDRTEEHAAELQGMRRSLTDHLGVATTMGFGPRFLHSTGQIHKGGKNNGLFIQITQTDARDLTIPGETYSFGVLKSSQAAGDVAALAQRGRRVLRIQIGSDVAAGLAQVAALIDSALS